MGTELDPRIHKILPGETFTIKISFPPSMMFDIEEYRLILPLNDSWKGPDGIPRVRANQMMNIKMELHGRLLHDPEDHTGVPWDITLIPEQPQKDAETAK